jgi:hypothetical protein
MAPNTRSGGPAVATAAVAPAEAPNQQRRAAAQGTVWAAAQRGGAGDAGRGGGRRRANDNPVNIDFETLDCDVTADVLKLWTWFAFKALKKRPFTNTDKNGHPKKQYKQMTSTAYRLGAAMVVHYSIYGPCEKIKYG